MEFQDELTKMRIVIDFTNTAKDALTTWSKVKLTYLVVSANRNTGGVSNIWATNVELTPIPTPNDDGQSILQGALFDTNDLTACGLKINGQDYKWNTNDINACNKDAAVHAYIMGFKFKDGVGA